MNRILLMIRNKSTQTYFKGRHDTQRNDTWYYDIQHNDKPQCYAECPIYVMMIAVMLSSITLSVVIMLSVI